MGEAESIKHFGLTVPGLVFERRLKKKPHRVPPPKPKGREGMVGSRLGLVVENEKRLIRVRRSRFLKSE